MPRVLVLNNYSFEEVWGEVKRQEKPNHHLYGINYFHRRGYEVEIIPFKSSRLLQSINSLVSKIRLPMPVGDLDQQWSILQFLNKADLIYSPCQTQTHVLSYLRVLGLLKVPVVCLAHHPLNGGRVAWLREPFINWWIEGTDAFPSLSRKVADTINEISHQQGKSYPLPWGPDADFYAFTSPVGQGVVAAGRTGRDFETFGRAASQTSIPVHIICLHSVSKSFQHFGNNVRVTIEPDRDYMKYPELVEIYANSRALAIPLLPGENLCGLTSLMDALGMGKPVIMTRNPFIDLDIEAEGIGKWVEPGDIGGWVDAIQFFTENEEAALVMGQRARKLVEAGMNSITFADRIMDVFDNILASH